MNTFVIEDFNVDEENVCNFYTVRVEDNDLSETDHFYEKFDQDDNEYLEDFGMIHELICQIATRGERLIRRSRDESKVFALPPEILSKDCLIDIFQNKLRLYYVPIAPGIIILLGGGIAHDKITGEQPDAFWQAQMFAKKIIDAKGWAFEINDNCLTASGDDGVITIY